MASSLLKKIRIRAARCTDQLLQLRAECATPEDAERLEQCIAAMRDASGRMDDVFHDYAPAVAPRRQKASSSPAPLPPSNPGKAPVYGPATGVYVAPPPQPKTFATQELSRPEGEDEFVVLPDNMTDAQFVDFSLRGHTSAYEIEAAKQLDAMPGWLYMDAAKRAAAIRVLAAEFQAIDISDDVQLVATPERLKELTPMPVGSTDEVF